MAAGETLPSLRELARDLQVSLITVTRAYNDLAAEGIIGTRQGKGTVVLPVDPARLRAHVDARIQRGLEEAVTAARLGGTSFDALRQSLENAWGAVENQKEREGEV